MILVKTRQSGRVI